MYENEIYSNSYNSNTSADGGAGDRPAGAGAQTESGSANSGGSPYFDYTVYPTGGVYADLSKAEATGEKKAKKPKKPVTGFRKVLLSAGMGLCFGLFAGAGFYAVKLGTAQITQAESQNANAQGQPPQIGGTLNSDEAPRQQVNYLTYVESNVSDVVERVMPAMVTINGTYTVTGYNFWGQAYSQKQQGGGSGIIVAETDNELLIVSNNHVVEDADELRITFCDGSTAAAVAKGLDADMDLAVVAVNLKDLSAETRSAIAIATLGDSSVLRLGEPVIAIGNALGYGQTVTNGIVSALNREVTMDDGSKGIFIQTNAAINEGNSGGALLNIRGEVIGINSSKIGGNAVDNVGFAIPISSASPIIAELMERQTRVKVAESEMGYLGIEMLSQEVPDEIRQLYNMPKGVYIVTVQEGSAAEKAGIMQRDVVVKVDGVKVTTNAELQKEMQYHAAGDTIEVTVMRLVNGEYETCDLEVTLGKKT